MWLILYMGLLRDMIYMFWSPFAAKEDYKFNKLMPVCYASLLLLMINCVITMSKFAQQTLTVLWHINKWTDAKKTDINLLFTITKPPKWLIAWLKWGEKMQCIKFYSSVLLLMIKISQWTHKNLHRYCMFKRILFFEIKPLKQHCKGAARSFVRKYKFKCKVCLPLILCAVQEGNWRRELLSTNTISNNFLTSQNVHTVQAQLF